jgi:hypothetical protein
MCSARDGGCRRRSCLSPLLRRALLVGSLLTALAACGGQPAPAPETAPSPVSGSGEGMLSELAPENPYPATTVFVPVPARTPALAVSGVCESGQSGISFAAVVAEGPADERERPSVVETAICDDGLRERRTIVPGGSWARSAPSTVATVQRAQDMADEVVVYEGGQRRPLPAAGGYSTNVPVPFSDGRVAMTAADDRGMRVVLSSSGEDYVVLATSPTTIDAFDYSPSGKRFVVLDSLGVPGAYTGSRLTVSDASGTRQHLLSSPFAAHLLVIDERRAIVGDIASRPDGSSVLVDLDSGVSRPFAVGLFPVAYHDATRRALMRDASGRLFWLDPDTGVRDALAGLGQRRVVGGDFLR